jgi:hypothetical protein
MAHACESGQPFLPALLVMPAKAGIQPLLHKTLKSAEYPRSRVRHIELSQWLRISDSLTKNSSSE